MYLRIFLPFCASRVNAVLNSVALSQLPCLRMINASDPFLAVSYRLSLGLWYPSSLCWGMLTGELEPSPTSLKCAFN